MVNITDEHDTTMWTLNSKLRQHIVDEISHSTGIVWDTLWLGLASGTWDNIDKGLKYEQLR